MIEGAAGQKVGADLAQLAGRTAAEDEAPPRFVFIVEVLDCVEYLRTKLRLVHDDNSRTGCGHEFTAGLNEQGRIEAEARTILAARKVDAERRAGINFPQEGALSRLACAEEKADVGLGRLPPKAVCVEAAIHYDDYLKVLQIGRASC